MREPRQILDLAGGTGSWSEPYRQAGYRVLIVDPFSEHPDAIKQDLRLFIPPKNIYGILAAPPCTHLAVSGARWWKEKGEEALLEGLSIVDACLRIVYATKPKFWALENPVGRLVHYIGKPTLIFDPYEYGNPTIKKTCLWGDFVLPKKNIVEPTLGQVVWRMPPAPDRAKRRSITPPEFAQAFFDANR